jgi:hypothetical protein
LANSYCSGWTYCDTFDGDFTIADWQIDTVGIQVAMSVSTARARSGTHSLLATRAADGGDDTIGYKLQRSVKECEFDMFLTDTFGNTSTYELAIAALTLKSTPFGDVEAMQTVFAEDGMWGRWQAVGNSSIGQRAPALALQPTRDQWVHVAMTIGGGQSISTSVLTVTNATGSETKTLSLPSVAFSSTDFTIGLYVQMGFGPNVEIYYDNVRCR